MLLFSEPFFSAEAAIAGVDLELFVESSLDGDFLKLIDRDTNETLESTLLSHITGPVRIVGSPYDDTLVLAVQPLFVSTYLPHGIFFEGGPGNDSLKGPSDDTTWNITGSNTGNLHGAGVVDFHSVENLIGHADNEDTFVFLVGGSLSGLIDGGDRGFDTLVLDGGVFQSVVYTATGPDSGTIDRDGDVITYAGLEPIIDNLIVADRVITTSDVNDQAELFDNNDGTLTLAPVFPLLTFESVTFAKPTNSLTINLGADLGIPFFPETLDIQALTMSAALIVNGDAGNDQVTFSGGVNLGGNPLTVNAEHIIVNPGVTVIAGNIAFNAVASVGTLATPDTLPVAIVAADVTIAGNLFGAHVSLIASSNLVSDVTNIPPIPGAPLLADVTAEVAVIGNATIFAAASFTAHAEANVNSTVTATAVAGLGVPEIAAATPVINSTARSRLSNNASVQAGGAVAIDAATNTVVNATADGITAITAIGTTTAIPIINVTTEAFIEDAARVLQSTQIDVTANATSTITTSASSTPDGAVLNPQTLADLQVATAAGPQTDAAAIAATTLNSLTRAFVTTSASLISDGDVSVVASSNHHVTTTADATPTVSPDNNGFAVAVNATVINDEAFVGGSPTINAPRLTIATGGGSQLSAVARSAAAGLGDANPSIFAGALALSTGINQSHAFVEAGAALTLIGNTDVEISAANTSVVDLSAEPQGAAVIATKLGAGRSVALNASTYTTQASIESGAQIVGARDLSLFANGDQTSLVTAYAGTLATEFGDIEEMKQLTVAGSIAINSSVAMIDVGAEMALSGSLNVAANHRGTSLIRARSDAAAIVGQGLTESYALPMALNLVTDRATTTVAGSVTAAGSVHILADADVANQAEGIAGVRGADPAATGADELVAAEIQFLMDRANLAFGSAPTPPDTDPDVDTINLAALTSNQTQGKAAAFGINLANTTATAEIAGTASVVAPYGPLSVVATSDVDSIALASASAVLNALGIAAGIAVNAQLTNMVASISGSATANEIVVATGNSGDGMHTLLAHAVSGTGIQAAGVAGAVAATQALGNSNAYIGSGAALTLTGGGNLTVSAEIAMENIAQAEPGVDAGTIFGVGAAFELNSSVFNTTAEIQDAVILGAQNVSVSANSDLEFTAEASAGADAGSGIGAAIAAVISDNTTSANVTNSTSPLNIGGDLSVTSHHRASGKHSADANVDAADVGAGAAVAIGVMQGGARAVLANTANVGGSVTVSAVTDAFMDADATASSTGVESDDLLVEFKLDFIMDLMFQTLLPPLTVNPVTQVDGGDNALVIPQHGLSTGDSVVYSIGEDDETIGSLVDAGTYFVRVVAPDRIRLHASRADAEANQNAINLQPASDADNAHILRRGTPVAISDLIAEGRTFRTADGAVGAAAAIAANMDFHSALAGIDVGGSIQSGGAVQIVATLNGDVDALATAAAVNSATSLGIAAAANFMSQSNQAFIAGHVEAPAVEVKALVGGDGVARFQAEAISGGGGATNVGVAGAFAVNVSAPLLPIAPITIPIPTLPPSPELPDPSAFIPQLPPLPALPAIALPALPTIPVPEGGEQNAVILDGASITLLGGGDLLVQSTYMGEYSATTRSTPQLTAAVGVGPSFSANAISQRVAAEIGDAVIGGTGVSGAQRSDIQVLASGTHHSNASATAGASSAINLPAAIALNYNDFQTTATAEGSGNLSGGLLVQATHRATTTHTAETDSGVAVASIGPAFALGFVAGGASASSGMDVQVGQGTVTVRADNESTLSAQAVSGQSGAEGDFDGDPVGEQVEKQIEGLLALAGLPEIPNEVIDVLQRVSAQTADGAVGIAAAVAGNLDYGYSKAALLDSSVIASSNAPLIEAIGDLNVHAVADANSVTSGTGVGVAVAFNVDGQVMDSVVAGVVNAPSIQVQTRVTGDLLSSFEATAVSGAGGADIGVAGAFAINISGNPLEATNPLDLLEPASGGQHNARIADGAVLNLSGVNLDLATEYVGSYTATATAVPGVGTLGFGPSVAINAVRHDTLVEIGANVVLTGVNDINITATGEYTSTTISQAGANNSGALPAAIALTGTSNRTIARMLAAETPSSIAGHVTVTASHTAGATTIADAHIGGAQVGLGAAIAAGGPQGGAIAQAGGHLTLPGHVTVLADTDSTAHTEAFASQSGALISGLSVDLETRRQLARLAQVTGLDELLFPTLDANPPLQAVINARDDVDGNANTIRIQTPHEFDTGDAVVYHNNQDDEEIGDLVDGASYFVRVSATDPALLTLHATRAQALAGTNPINLSPVAAPEDRHSFVAERTFDPASAIDGAAETVELGAFAGLATGDAVKYFNGGGNDVGGLQDGGLYYVSVDASNPAAIRVQLFTTRLAAMAASGPIDLDPSAATGTQHRIVKVVDAYRPLGVGTTVDPAAAVDSNANTVDLSGLDGPVNGDAVIYRNGGGNNIGGLVDDTVYYVLVSDDDLTKVGLLTTKSAGDRADLDASAATGTAHRFERVAIESIDPTTIPNIRFGAAAAIAVGAGRPVSHAAISNGSTIHAGGNVLVTASMDFDADAQADALSILGVASVGVAAAGNYSEGRHIAEIGDGASVTAHFVSVVALGESDVSYDYTAHASSKAVDLGGNVAGSVAVNAMRNETAARIGKNAAVNSTTAVDVLANLRRDGVNFVNAGTVRAVARAGELGIGALGAAGAAVAGALTLDGDRVEAIIADGASVTAGTDIEVRAQGHQVFDNRAVGGSLGLLASASIGAAFSISNTAVRAVVEGAALEAQTGAITVLADTDSNVDSLALGLAGSGLAGFGGAVAVNVIANTTAAIVSGGATVAAQDDLIVSATDRSKIHADSAGLAAILGILGVGAGFGISIAANNVENTVIAEIDDATVTDAASVQVQATAELTIAALTAVGVAVAAPSLLVGVSVAGAGSGAANRTRNRVLALIGGGSVIEATVGPVRVDALDNTTVSADAGSFAIGVVAGTVAGLGISAAAAVAVNDLGNEIRATISGSNVQSTGNVALDATAQGSASAFALGLAGAASGGLIASLSVAGAGSAAGNLVANTIEALVENSTITPGGTLELVAEDQLAISADAGAGALAIGGGGIAGVGLGVGISLAGNSVTNTIRAAIDGSTVTNAGSVSVDAQSNATIGVITGVGVGVVEGGGLVGAALGGAASGSANQVSNTIEALITGGSTISGTSGGVTVEAFDNAILTADAGSGVLSFGASVAIGAGVGVAAAVAVNDVSTTTRAAVIDSTVSGGPALSVQAISTTSIQALAFGIAGVLSAGGLIGAGFSAAGAGALNHTSNNVEAMIDGSTVSNLGGVTVNAEDQSTIAANVAGASLGVSAGILSVNVAIGISVAENQINNQTAAWIDDSSVASSGSIHVTANSTADIAASAVGTSLSASLGGVLALNVAVVGAVTLNSVANTTEAAIRDSGDDLSEQFTATTILVRAIDDSTITTHTAAASVGITGSAGITGALNFAVSLSTNDIGNQTRAIIDNSPVQATTGGTISVMAESNAEIDAVAFALQMNVAAGLAAVVGGAVGAATLNNVQNTTEAIIRDSGSGVASKVTAPGLIRVQATDDSSITADTGTTSLQFSAGAVSGNVSLTASVAANDVANTTRASIDNSSVESTNGAIHVLANSNADIDALAVAFSLTASVGGISILGGAIGGVTLNTVGGTTEAVIRDSGNLANQRVRAQGDIRVEATDAAIIRANTATASVSIGGGFVAVGVSVALNLATNDVATTTRALIDNSRVQSMTGSVIVDATSTADIGVFAVGMGIAGSGGLATITANVVGATALNAISNTLEAVIRNSESGQGQGVTAPLAITVTALDNSQIHSDAIAGSVSANAALVSLGLDLTVAGSTNEIGNHVITGIESSYVESTTQNVAVLAKSTSTITVSATAATLSVSFAPIGFSVAASGAFAENNTTSTIEAFIRNGSVVLGRQTLIADDGVRVEAVDIASIASNVIGGSFSVALSGVALGVSGSTSTIDNTVRASIEGSTVTAVTGNLTVHADANQHVIANAVAAGASFGVGAAISGAVALTKINSDVEAWVHASTLNTNAATGVLTVKATSDLHADADAHGFAGGFGLAALAVARPTAEIGGTTRAWASGNTTTNTRKFNILADSKSFADANTVSVGVGIVGVAAAASAGLSTVSRTTEAYMGTRAGTAPGAPVTIGAVNAEVLVKATSDSDARVQAVGGALGPLITISGFLGEAKITGATLAYVGEALTLNAGELDVLADADEKADALTVAVGAGFIAGQGAKAVALIETATEAFLGTRDGATPSGVPTTINVSQPVTNPAADGTVVVEVQSRQIAEADAKGGGLAAIQVAAMLPEATAGGKVRAYVGNGTVLTAASLTVTAEAPVMKAFATVSAVGISAFVGLAVLEAKTNVTGEVEAFIGAQASDVTTAASTPNINTGALTVIADTQMDAVADVASIAASFALNLSKISPQAETAGATRAYIRDGAAVTASSLTLHAGQSADRIKYTASAEVDAVGLSGLANVALVDAKTTTGGVTEAFIGAPAGMATPSGLTNLINIGGSTRIEAWSDLDAISRVNSLGISLGVTLGDMDTTADVTGETRAYVGQGANLTVQGNLTVRANGDYDAKASTDVIGVSLLANIGLFHAVATVSGIVDAHVGSAAGTTPDPDAGTLTVNGDLKIDAHGDMFADPSVQEAGFSLGANVGDMTITGIVDGVVRAYIGEGVVVSADSVEITADALMKTTPVGESFGGAAIADLSFIEVNATVSGTVEAFIGAHASKNASAVTTSVNVGNGDVDVFANARMEATAEADSVSFGGLVTLSSFLPTAIVDGRVSAYVRDGVALDAGTLDVNAGKGGDEVEFVASADSRIIGITLGFGLNIAEATATAAGVAEAYLGATNGRTRGGLPGADIDVTGAVVAEARSDIDATAVTRGGGAGTVTVSALTPTADAGGSTRAYAGDGLAIRANSLDLSAHGDARSKADITTFDFSLLATIQSLTPIAKTTNVVEAYLGNNSFGTPSGRADVQIRNAGGGRGPVKLTATADTLAEAKMFNVGGSFAVAVNILEPKAEMAGATRAYVGKDTDLFSGTVTLNASETTAQAIAETGGGSGAGIAQVTVISAEAAASRLTEVFVDNGANLNLGGTSLIGTATTSTGAPLASAGVTKAGGGGIASVNKISVDARVGLVDANDAGSQASATRAYVGNGATIVAHNVTLDAISNTTAEAKVHIPVALGGVVQVTLTELTGTAAHNTQASIGNNSTLTLSGALSLKADAQTTASPSVVNFSGSFGVSFQDSDVTTKINSDTSAFIGNGGTINATSVKLLATAKHTAEANIDSVGFGGLLAIGVLNAKAEDTGSVRARIGPTGAGSASNPTVVNATGAAGIDVDAKLLSTVKASPNLTSLSLLGSGGSTDAIARNDATVSARIGGHAQLHATAGPIDVQAELLGVAQASSSVFGAALGVAISRVDAHANFTPNVAFTVGDNAKLTAGGAHPINLTARLNHDGSNFLVKSDNRGAIADGDNVAGSALVASADSDIFATSNADVSLSVGSNAVFDAVTGDINVLAQNSNSAFAAAQNTAGALIAVSSADARPTATGSTTLSFLGDVGASGAAGGNNLNVTAEASTISDAAFTSSSGGLVTVTGAGRVQATTNSNLELIFGGGSSDIRVGGNITVQAIQSTDADAKTKGGTGGAVTVANLNANINATANVDLTVGDANIIEAGGLIHFLAQHGAEGTEVSDGTIISSVGANPPLGAQSAGNTNFIDFGAAHQLQDGARITFLGSGGGLTNEREYSVVVRDANTVHLGGNWSGAVNTVFDTIFLPNHRFVSGDPVYYHANGPTSVGGLQTGKRYIVNVVDENTIKLKDPAVTTPDSVFSRGAVSGSPTTITNNHSFQNGDAVTYRLVEPALFTAALIDVNVTNTAPFTFVVDNQDRIFIENHGFTAGQRVVYRTDGTNPIVVSGGPNLVDGDVYFVVNGGTTSLGTFPGFTSDPNYIRLARTLNEAIGFIDDKGTPDPADDEYVPPSPMDLVRDANNPDLHSLRREANEPLSGLTEGRVYFVVNSTPGVSYQLALTSGGVPITFSNSGIFGGTHRFTIDGVDLTSSGGFADGGHHLILDIHNGATGSFSGMGGARGSTAAPSGDLRFAVSTSGAAGGAITVNNAKADGVASIDTDLTVNGATIIGNGVVIETKSFMSVAAVSDSTAGGGISIGESDTTAKGTNNSDITINPGANIQSTTDLRISATIDSTVTAAALTDQAAFLGSGSEADAEAGLIYNVTNTVKGHLEARGDIVVETRTKSNVQADAEAEAFGLFGSNAEADADARIGTHNFGSGNAASDENAASRTIIGDGANLVASSVTVAAYVDKMRARAFAKTRATSAGGKSDAAARSYAAGIDQVQLLHGSEITGNESILVEAVTNQVSITSHADGQTNAAGGKTDVVSLAELNNRAKIEGYWEALLRSTKVDVNAVQNSPVASATSRRSGAWVDFGGTTKDDTTNARREIYWEGHVILLGEPNPELEIDENGKIVKLTNIEFRGVNAGKEIGQTLWAADGSNPQVVLDDIIYDQAGRLTFFANEVSDAPDGVIWGNHGLVDSQRTWDYVRIINRSAFGLVINHIDTSDGAAVVDIIVDDIRFTDPFPNNVSLDPGSPGVTFEFDVYLFYPQTMVEIRNLVAGGNADSDIILLGGIENTIGWTIIENQRGHVRVDERNLVVEQGALPVAIFDKGLIRTNRLDVDASGDIGNQNALNGRKPLMVELVRITHATQVGETPALKQVHLEADAGGDAVLDITLHDRSQTPALGSLAVTIHRITAGDDVDVVVNDSKAGDNLSDIEDRRVVRRRRAADLPDHQRQYHSHRTDRRHAGRAHPFDGRQRDAGLGPPDPGCRRSAVDRRHGQQHHPDFGRGHTGNARSLAGRDRHTDGLPGDQRRPEQRNRRAERIRRQRALQRRDLDQRTDRQSESRYRRYQGQRFTTHRGRLDRRCA